MAAQKLVPGIPNTVLNSILGRVTHNACHLSSWRNASRLLVAPESRNNSCTRNA